MSHVCGRPSSVTLPPHGYMGGWVGVWVSQNPREAPPPVSRSNGLVPTFCAGTVLAVANFFGLSATGIDISPKRCRQSERATVDSILTQYYPSPARTSGGGEAEDGQEEPNSDCNVPHGPSDE